MVHDAVNAIFRFFILILTLCLARTAFAAPNPTTPYTDFMRDRQGFSWRLISRGRDVTTLEMTSQKWKESTWQHRIVIYYPENLQYPDAAALFLTTQQLPFDNLTGRAAAEAIGAPFVIVYDVPNQPLWGKTENGLFGYSVSQAIETSDGSWSLAFPMAKTAARAMDAVNIYNGSSRNPECKPISRWMLIGFSKRGLAAWLAATDKRVTGLVSLAYNNLNTPKQADAQRADWGELSPKLKPYLENGVEEAMATPKGQAILDTWDPYFFRNQLNKPKLVVDATGNDYWSLRAFDQYADDLPGVTNFLMVGGTDHYMVSAFNKVFGAATAWCHWTLGNKPLPQPKLTRAGKNWHFEASGAKAATLNFAWSQSNDFRGAEWEKMPMRKSSGGQWEAEMPTGKGNIAVFAAGDWPDGELTLPLSSRVVISKN